MLVLILAVIFALGVGYIATQNAMAVTLQMGNQLFTGIPLYFVIVASLLSGLLIGWIFNLAGSLGSMFALRGKDSNLKAVNSTNESLQNRVHGLEIENAELRASNPGHGIPREAAREVHKETIDTPRRSFLENIRESFRRKAY